MSWLLESDTLLKAVGASYLQKGTSSFVGLEIDSRKIKEAFIFFAIKGVRFDGHDFLNQAFVKGAKAFVISEKQKAEFLLKYPKITLILVPDTLKALQDLARFWTQKQRTKVLAITGSNGKTTTRAFTQTLLSRFSAFASPKSYNNSIGVSLSLLQVDRENSFLIQEFGTNQPGEIAYLSSLCDPLVSGVTMVGISHLEGFGSIDSIAQEKQQIYLKNPKATWIFNRDNSYTEKMFQELSPSHKNVLSFSQNQKEMDVNLYYTQEDIQTSVVEGQIASVKGKAKVSFSGKPNLENLMCACSLALAVGVDPQDIWDFIPKCKLPSGRSKWFQYKEKNISVLFDAYNANPTSMDFFLSYLGELSKKKRVLFVLGDMKELGKESIKYHKKLAEHPALLKACFICFIGEYASLVEQELKKLGFKGCFISAKNYDTQLLSLLKKELKPEDILALKASRSLKLENLLFELTGFQAL